MFYDKKENRDSPDERHRPHKHGHHGHGRHGLHSGRKLSSSELQLLLLLSKQPSHGHELIKSLDERSDGFYVPSPGMIYPALTYLEEIGHTSVQAEGNKKLYQLTSAGKTHLRQNRKPPKAFWPTWNASARRWRTRARLLKKVRTPVAFSKNWKRRGAKCGAQREREPFTLNEAKRIAAILEQATKEITEANVP